MVHAARMSGHQQSRQHVHLSNMEESLLAGGRGGKGQSREPGNEEAGRPDFPKIARPHFPVAALLKNQPKSSEMVPAGTGVGAGAENIEKSRNGAHLVTLAGPEYSNYLAIRVGLSQICQKNFERERREGPRVARGLHVRSEKIDLEREW